MFAGAGNTDVEQATFLFDGIIGSAFNGVADGYRAFDEANEEHRIPFEAFGRVHGCQGDAVHRGGMLCFSALPELANQGGHVWWR